MPVNLKTAAKIALSVAALSAAFVAGAVTNETTNKIDQTHDMLTKADAILGSIVTRKGLGAIESARAKIKGAQQDLQTAKSHIGG
jgi:hypothetical protein